MTSKIRSRTEYLILTDNIPHGPFTLKFDFKKQPRRCGFNTILTVHKWPTFYWATSVLQIRSRLKTELFARSYQQSHWIRLRVTVTLHFFPWSWSLWIYITLMTILILT